MKGSLRPESSLRLFRLPASNSVYCLLKKCLSVYVHRIFQITQRKDDSLRNNFIIWIFTTRFTVVQYIVYDLYTWLARWIRLGAAFNGRKIIRLLF